MTESIRQSEKPLSEKISAFSAYLEGADSIFFPRGVCEPIPKRCIFLDRKG